MPKEACMDSAGRVVAAGLLFLVSAIAPAGAEEAGHPARAIELTHGCLSQKERRALVDSGSVVRLAAAMHALRGHVSGTLVRARLCRRPEGLVYLLTVLTHDGKVARLTVDAAKGTLVSGR
jgi:uncharacterized membrane protein YkoI